jgi:serine protease
VVVLDSGMALNALPAFSGGGERVMQGYDFISDEMLSNDGDGRDPDFYDPGDADDTYCFGEPSSFHGTKKGTPKWLKTW